jgi:hypothetical protein
VWLLYMIYKHIDHHGFWFSNSTRPNWYILIKAMIKLQGRGYFIDHAHIINLSWHLRIRFCSFESLEISMIVYHLSWWIILWYSFAEATSAPWIQFVHTLALPGHNRPGGDLRLARLKSFAEFRPATLGRSARAVGLRQSATILRYQAFLSRLFSRCWRLDDDLGRAT